MTAKEIIEKVKTLNFPAGSYIVFGSCPMALVGIREAQDIDMLVNKVCFQKCHEMGWKELIKSPADKPLVFEDFEAHPNWNFSHYKPTLEHLLATADIVDGVPFASLAEVRKWKVGSGRPKDLVDIKLIDDYMMRINGTS